METEAAPRTERDVTGDEVNEAITGAMKTLGGWGVESRVPGMCAFMVKEQIKLGEVSVDGHDLGLWRGKSVEPGMYFMRLADVDKFSNGGGGVFPNDTSPAIYSMHLPEESMEEFQGLVERAESEPDKKEWDGPAPQIRFEMATIDAENGKHLTLFDLATWYAYATASQSGDEALGRAILGAVYATQANGLEAGQVAGKLDAAPTKHVLPMSRLTNHLEDIGFDGKVHPVRVSPKDAPIEISSKVKLEYKGRDELVIKGLTRFDLEVNKTFCSLHAAGKRTVSEATVYRHMYGSTSKVIRKEAKQKILESVKLQRDVDLLADCREEIGDRKIMIEDENGEQIEVSPAIIRERLLNVDFGVWTTSDGKPYVVYQINAEPPLMKHDRAMKQFLTYPQELLEAVNHSVQQNEQNTAIRTYLMYRIGRMANGSSATTKILYDSILEGCGLSNVSRTQRSRYIDAVRKMLDVFVAEKWHVKRWREYPPAENGRNPRKKGVEITLIPSQAKKKGRKAPKGKRA